LINIPFFDESHLPVGLGNALRVPHYAWENWGITYNDEDDFLKLVKLSEKYYRDEWELTTEEGHGDIREASKKAGFDNFPLNEQSARMATRIIEMISGKVKILDIGAGTGGTVIQILKTLDEVDPEQLHFTLLDPARKSLEEAKSKLDMVGLQQGKHFVTIAVPDVQIEDFLKRETFDLATSVAAIHHHAYLTKPFECVYNVLKPGGFFLTSDWHNSMWEHPAKVFELIKEMTWATKEEDLKMFVEAYPRSLDAVPKETTPEAAKANEMIKGFWKAYAEIKTTRKNQFLILEGHRPVQRYIEEMKKVGFETMTPTIQKAIGQNPHQILPDSTLLMVTIGQKL
jgi:ubiquinone/menaquinone biosynthesis C-methylase UbiE